MLLASGNISGQEDRTTGRTHKQAADDELEGIVSKIDSPSQFENGRQRPNFEPSRTFPSATLSTVMLTTSGGGHLVSGRPPTVSQSRQPSSKDSKERLTPRNCCQVQTVQVRKALL